MVFTGCSQAAAAWGFGGFPAPKGTWKGGNPTNPTVWSRGRLQSWLSHRKNWFAAPAGDHIVPRGQEDAENFGELLCNPSLPAQGFPLLRRLGWCHHCPAPLRDARHIPDTALSSQGNPECAEPPRSPRMGVNITQEGS